MTYRNLVKRQNTEIWRLDGETKVKEKKKIKEKKKNKERCYICKSIVLPFFGVLYVD